MRERPSGLQSESYEQIRALAERFQAWTAPLQQGRTTLCSDQSQLWTVTSGAEGIQSNTNEVGGPTDVGGDLLVNPVQGSGGKMFAQALGLDDPET